MLDLDFLNMKENVKQNEEKECSKMAKIGKNR